MTSFDSDIRLASDFPANLFVIDPKGCGCTDCLMQWSTPIDQLEVEDILKAIKLGMEILDRT